MKDRFSMHGWVELVHTRDGVRMPVWRDNRLGKWLRRCWGVGSRGLLFLGCWADSLAIPNTITNKGHAMANGKMSNQGGYGTSTYLAIGTGTQGSPSTATALSAEISTNGGARALATASQVTTSVANDTTQLVYTWTFSGSFAITEEGVFDASSTGNMPCYQSFTAINVVSSDQLTVTHKYQT